MQNDVRLILPTVYEAHLWYTYFASTVVTMAEDANSGVRPGYAIRGSPWLQIADSSRVTPCMLVLRKLPPSLLLDVSTSTSYYFACDTYSMLLISHSRHPPSCNRTRASVFDPAVKRTRSKLFCWYPHHDGLPTARSTVSLALAEHRLYASDTAECKVTILLTALHFHLLHTAIHSIPSTYSSFCYTGNSALLLLYHPSASPRAFHLVFPSFLR